MSDYNLRNDHQGHQQAYSIARTQSLSYESESSGKANSNYIFNTPKINSGRYN